MNTIRVPKKQIRIIVENCVRKQLCESYSGQICLNESELDELQGYHGSGADFDKFNHKKYLSTGAGSQSFGWGTYVSDDKEIGLSYAEGNDKEYITRIGDTIIRKSEDLVPFIKDYLSSKGYGNDPYNGLCFMDFASKIFSKLNNGYGIEDTKNMFISSYNEIMQTYKTKLDGNGGSLPQLVDEYYKSKSDVSKVLIQCMDLLKSQGLTTGKRKSYLYEVDIPDDNGSNYINWYEHFPSEFMKRILIGLSKLNPKHIDAISKRNYPFRNGMGFYLKNENFNKIIDIIANSNDYQSFFDTADKGTEGRFIYRHLQKWFGSDRIASTFLSYCGFVGIKYQTDTIWKNLMVQKKMETIM